MDKYKMQEWLFRTALVFVIKQANEHEDILLRNLQNPALREVVDKATDSLATLLIKLIGTRLKTDSTKVTDIEIIRYNGMKDLYLSLKRYDGIERLRVDENPFKNEGDKYVE